MRIYVGHKPIKPFRIAGRFLDEADTERVKRKQIQVLTWKMQEVGYGVLDDIDPAFSLKYNDGGFDFLLTLHGVYLGKVRAKACEAIYNGTAILNTTAVNK